MARIMSGVLIVERGWGKEPVVLTPIFIAAAESTDHKDLMGENTQRDQCEMDLGHG